MEHPQHCQNLAEQIAAETDEAKRERLREQFRNECQDDGPVTLEDSSMSTLDSGGGGAGNPPRPPARPGIDG